MRPLQVFSPKQIEIALWIVAAAISFFIYSKDFVAKEHETKVVVEEYKLRTHIKPGELFRLPGDVAATLPRPASIAPVIFGTAFLIIPLLCRLIFNAMPIELLRLKISGVPIQFAQAPAKPSELSRLESVENTDLLQTATALQYLRSLARASRQIADKIYLRAGVYLLVGVLIAFSGLAFFYSQQASDRRTDELGRVVSSVAALGMSLLSSSNLDEARKRAIPETIEKAESGDWKDSLMHTLPRFGILFFIETIAFFFLRQYRTAMDEYRYFEAIKRRREENFVLLCLLGSGNPIDLTKLPQQVSLYSDVAALAQGQTTDLLESRKLNKEETAILEKVVDAITKIKG